MTNDEWCPKCSWWVEPDCNCKEGPSVSLLEASKAVLKWADDLKPYADDGTQVVTVFEELREAIKQAEGGEA